MEKQKFVESILHGARESYRNYGILPSVTIAQAILESAWGDSGLTKAANNLFGIKWTEGCGFNYINYLTNEVIAGKVVKVNAKFRAYNTLDDSIVDHGAFIAKYKRYESVLSSTTYYEQCSQLQKCGYATDPSYAQKLINIIEQNGLAKYDSQEDENILTYVFSAGTTNTIEVNGVKVRIMVLS